MHRPLITSFAGHFAAIAGSPAFQYAPASAGPANRRCPQSPMSTGSTTSPASAA
ncbi:hypothetical protein V6L77_22115 [Pannonibacter sp. Pt2-lr]